MLEDKDVPLLGGRIAATLLFAWALLTWIPRQAGLLSEQPAWYDRLNETWQDRFGYGWIS